MSSHTLGYLKLDNSHSHCATKHIHTSIQTPPKLLTLHLTDRTFSVISANFSRQLFKPHSQVPPSFSSLTQCMSVESQGRTFCRVRFHSTFCVQDWLHMLCACRGACMNTLPTVAQSSSRFKNLRRSPRSINCRESAYSLSCYKAQVRCDRGQ